MMSGIVFNTRTLPLRIVEVHSRLHTCRVFSWPPSNMAFVTYMWMLRGTLADIRTWHIHVANQDCNCCSALLGPLPSNKRSDPDLNQACHIDTVLVAARVSKARMLVFLSLYINYLRKYDAVYFGRYVQTFRTLLTDLLLFCRNRDSHRGPSTDQQNSPRASGCLLAQPQSVCMMNMAVAELPHLPDHHPFFSKLTE